MVIEKIKEINNYAWGEVPTIFLTVMAWMGAQKVAESIMANYAPNLAGWPLGAAELGIAIIGLYLISKRKENLNETKL